MPPDEGFADPGLAPDSSPPDAGGAPPDAGGAGPPADAPPVIDPRAFQALYERNQQFERFGDPDSLAKRLENAEKFERLHQAISGDGKPKLSEREMEFQAGLRKLEPWVAHASRLTEKDIELLALLQQNRPYLESLPVMARSTAVSNEYAVSKAEETLDGLAKEAGLDKDDTYLLHKLVRAEIMGDPRIHRYYASGGVQQKVEVVNHFAPDLVKALKRNQIRADAGRQAAAEGVAGAAKAPGRGAPAGPIPEAEPEDLDSAHAAFFKDLQAAEAR